MDYDNCVKKIIVKLNFYLHIMRIKDKISGITIYVKQTASR